VQANNRRGVWLFTCTPSVVDGGGGGGSEQEVAGHGAIAQRFKHHFQSFVVRHHAQLTTSKKIE
jgi:hypothetical protein